MKKIIVIIILLLALTSCGKKDTTQGTLEKINFKETKEITNFVKIDTTQGIILLELYPDIAPITVKNFQKLIQEKHYDNTIFHRVIKDFMIQGGQNTSKEAETIKGEFERNDIENNLKHDRGIISMARPNDYDGASDQFFIVHAKSPHLDGAYAAFGKVIAGLNTVDKIATTNVEKELPTTEQKIKTIRFIEIDK